jgi:hypothetical protein
VFLPGFDAEGAGGQGVVDNGRLQDRDGIAAGVWRVRQRMIAFSEAL